VIRSEGVLYTFPKRRLHGSGLSKTGRFFWQRPYGFIR
jgi:hypothetical protein